MRPSYFFWGEVNKASSPFSTGGGGARFEFLVATAYMVSLLKGESARGLPPEGAVVEVRFQQKIQEYPVDDIVIVASMGTIYSKLALQVKHNIRFAVNKLFCEIIQACWEQ